MPFLSAAMAGLGTGLALIIPIGAQNAFVLRQGIRGEHVTLVVAVCLLSDIVLIAAGIAGISEVVRVARAVIFVIRFGGAAFLIAYGALAAYRALHPGVLTPSSQPGALTRRATLATVLALTWLNPHVYLDTVLLLGSLANDHGEERWWFGLGSALASALWFSALGFGASLLRPMFAKPTAWRVLDALTALVMVLLGVRLAWGF